MIYEHPVIGGDAGLLGVHVALCYCGLMFIVKTQDIDRFERDLLKFAKSAYPFATKATVNTSAFTAQKIAREDLSKKMILRNKFSAQSIQVEQTRSLQVTQQRAVVGSVASYMADLEFGGVKTKGGKKGVSIATSFASGEGDNTQPRSKLPRRSNRLENIQLRKSRGRRAKNRKQTVLFKIQDAVTTGRRFIFLDLGRKQGIFRVKGGSKSFKRGGPRGAKLKMVHDLSEQSVRIPRNPWLGPATIKTERKIPEIYRKALEFQLRRQGLFT